MEEESREMKEKGGKGKEKLEREILCPSAKPIQNWVKSHFNHSVVDRVTDPHL